MKDIDKNIIVLDTIVVSDEEQTVLTLDEAIHMDPILSALDRSLVHEDVTSVEFMLTTTDNPYDPFDEFDKWFTFDTVNGYNTCGLIARLGNFASSLTDKEQTLERLRTFEKILSIHNYEFYEIVMRENNEETESEEDR